MRRGDRDAFRRLFIVSSFAKKKGDNNQYSVETIFSYLKKYFDVAF